MLLEHGPPFDPAERGFARHAVNESFGAVAGALGTWRELVEDPPRIARPVYTWERGDD